MSENKIDIYTDPKTLELDKYRPCVIRHYYSGVWIGWAIGPGEYDGTLLFAGRRVHGWRGGRLETTQLARLGCREGDSLGDPVVSMLNMREGLVEVHGTSHDTAQKALELPVCQV